MSEYTDEDCNYNTDYDAFIDFERQFTDSMEDVMMRASNNGDINTNKLVHTFRTDGLMGVYNLGLQHMYLYLKKIGRI